MNNYNDNLNVHIQVKDEHLDNLLAQLEKEGKVIKKHYSQNGVFLFASTEATVYISSGKRNKAQINDHTYSKQLFGT